MVYEYPTTSKALRFTTPGSPLQVVEKDVPPLPENEILIRVHKASINPVDIQLWKAQVLGVIAGDKGIGRDYAGTVVAVGSTVKGFEQGDRVFGLLFQAVSFYLLQSLYCFSNIMSVGSGHFQPIHQCQPGQRRNSKEPRLLHG